MYRNTNCMLQAHRGVCTEAPENTMAAYRLAVAQGYDIIEFDPKCTKDDIWVVHHDMALNRTCRLAGKEIAEPNADIRDYTYDELVDLDVGEWYGPQFAGERIPMLSQVLDYLRGQGIEGKIDNVFERFSAGQQKLLFDIVEKHADTTKVGLTSTKVRYLEQYGARFPKAPLHYDGDVDDETLDKLAAIADGHVVTVWMHMGTSMVSWCKRPAVTPEVAAKIKARGFKLGIWILADDEEMARALAFGADVVETTGGIKP